MNRRRFSQLSTLGLAATALRGASAALAAATEPPGQHSEQIKTSRGAWLKEARFGTFISLDVSTVLGEDVIDQVMNGIPADEYAKLKERFNPTEFSAEEWVGLFKDAGIRYVILTTKNISGFALWDTKLSDFSVMHSPFRRDICKELADECHRQHMPLVFYYCFEDWHSPLYRPSLKQGTPVSQEFLNFMFGQVRELCTNHGELGYLLFDGDWNHTPAQWQSDKLVEMVRKLQPKALVNNRLGTYNPERVAAWERDRLGDLSTLEMSWTFIPVPKDPGRLWEFDSTLNDNWAYAEGDDRFKSAGHILRLLVESVSRGGNYSVGIGPMPSGKFHPEVVARLRQVGQWLKRNGESIYGAEGFEPLYYDNAFMTKRGDTFYLHLFDWAPGARCDLWTLGLKDAKRAYFLETGQPVEFMKKGAKRSYTLAAGEPAEFAFAGWEGSLRLLTRNTNPEPSPDTVIVFEGGVPLRG